MKLVCAFWRVAPAAAVSFAALPVWGAGDAPVVPDIAAYESVLTRFVRIDGRVDYFGLKNSPALPAFIRQIEAVSPDSHPALFPSKEGKLAYWINAYNALVLHAFAKDYPAKRTRLSGTPGRTYFFYLMKHKVGGRSRSLADIEDNSIRNAGDPRIHFAIVCASAGCPALARSAYHPKTLSEQLEMETKKYFSEARNFSIDMERRELKLPKILEWFKGDFGRTEEEVIAFVARYRPQEAGVLRNGGWRVTYSEYDWSPNDIRR
jgi:hypothetical protein